MKAHVAPFHSPQCDEDAAFFTFQPRPDRPEMYDEQESFINAMDTGVAFHVGGNACLAGDTLVTDARDGWSNPISQIRKPLCLWSLNPQTGLKELRLSGVPFCKGTDLILRIEFSNGVAIRCTDAHAILNDRGTWVRAGQLRVGDAVLRPLSCDTCPPAMERQWHEDDDARSHQCVPIGQLVEAESSHRRHTICESGRRTTEEVSHNISNVLDAYGQCWQSWQQPQPPRYVKQELFLSLLLRCVQNCLKRVADWTVHCSSHRRLCDEQLLLDRGIVRDAVPLRGDVLSHIQCKYSMDGSDFAMRCSRVSSESYQCRTNSFRWSSFFQDDVARQEDVASSIPTCHCDQLYRRFCERLNSLRNTFSSNLQELQFALSHPQSFNVSASDAVIVTKIEECGKEEFWDISVPPFANYILGGVVHANSGTSTAAACKIARLLLSRQEAPRYDTPFWIVGVDYEQTIESMWKEKLHGMQFIPDYEVDWDRVTWHDKRRALPSTVPLKPWVGGDKKKNWVIEFRSFAQGRMAMQARALGGFCLTEQFPWEILTEILRGMRQHNLPGAKFCEFTPVDPAMSAPLKQMMEDNTLPPGWAVYRANTLCNVLDENSPVDQEWYDEFFGMVGEEMRDTRQLGAWATYEGLIYKSLNPKVHFVDNIVLPENGIHKRGIDWGSGPHNAFVVIWSVRDNNGRWICYDEYYTTESNTWEERIRHVHEKDGYHLVMSDPGPPASYTLIPMDGQRPRWRYQQSNFQQTYAPPDQPGLFRECAKYCLPVVMGKTGFPHTYYPSIECVQGLLKYTPDTFREGTEPRLIIDKGRCPNLCRELQMLRWQIPPHHATNPRAPKPHQVQDQDHAPDALRAIVYSDLIEHQSQVSGHRVEPKYRPQVRHKRVTSR